MKSTGEVMGFDKNFGMAFAKSQIAASNSLPKNGLAFISLKDSHKDEDIYFAKAAAVIPAPSAGTPSIITTPPTPP